MSQGQLWDAGNVAIKKKRGRPITSCHCGSCSKCKRRDYMRVYMDERKTLGRRPRRPKLGHWTPEADALLGKGPDRVVAIVLRRSWRSVVKRRTRLGIAPFRRHKLRHKGFINDNGYRVLKLDTTDPLYSMARSDGQVMEHRLVMARHLGRPLDAEESVHHRNGERLDNRIENLELWSRSHPHGQRVEDKLAWAKELIARYEGVFLREISTVTDRKSVV